MEKNKERGLETDVKARSHVILLYIITASVERKRSKE